MLPLPPSSSICSSRLAGKEWAGDATVLDREKEEEATGVTEEGAGK